LLQERSPMFRKVRIVPCMAVCLGVFFSCTPAWGQGVSGLHARPMVTQSVDENQRVSLRGNTRPEANLRHDRGAVPDALPMEHMLLQLKRSGEQEQALQQFIDELHRPGSPNFHHWITAQEFGERFGLPVSDIQAITNWLTSRGFIVNSVYPN